MASAGNFRSSALVFYPSFQRHFAPSLLGCDLNPLDLVSAHPWRRVSFTTYALSLSFFEAVVLDAMIRGGSRDAVILSDIEGVRAGLSEQGAQRVGREYFVEPVGCTTGVFHPKVSVFESDDDCHLLVGSGNLTFGGWGRNLEVVEHLHPSFAGDAFDDAADLFESLTIDDRIRMGAHDRCVQLAESLRRAARGHEKSGSIRLLHSVGETIASQIARFSDELGGAIRLTVVSPFFDDGGNAISRLAALLGCSEITIHSHPAGIVRGRAGRSWPESAPFAFSAVRLDGTFGQDSRGLHAKMFEIVCRRGRLVLSGSANATGRALLGGNVEASILRIERGDVSGWSASVATAPLLDIQSLEGEAASKSIGILRAELSEGALHGRVISPHIHGLVLAECEIGTEIMDLGSVSVSSDGSFQIPGATLEARAWASGRLHLRLHRDDTELLGIVSLSEISKVLRRAGPLGSRLLSMLAGTETPTEVAAILSYFGEDLSRLPTSGSHLGGTWSTRNAERSVFVPLTSLSDGVSVVTHSATEADRTEWRKMIRLVLAAFAPRRGPWLAEIEDAGDEISDDQRVDHEAAMADANNRIVTTFDDLLIKMLAPSHEGKHTTLAFGIALYIADRVRPPVTRVRGWLWEIFRQPSFKFDGDPGLRSALIMLYGTENDRSAARHARRYLLAHGLDPTEVNFDRSSIAPLIEFLAPKWSDKSFITEIREVRTGAEEVRSYLAALASGTPVNAFPLLVTSDQWSRLSSAIVDPGARSRLVIAESLPSACPKCHMGFRKEVIRTLQDVGVCECPSCRRTILCRGP